ncbi:uncharacterized protein [Diadema setosum]|uniref:uncharacterized protein n=1 Tax=Diadema setosum TaxID=31175 RepID=UPI003B3A3113
MEHGQGSGSGTPVNVDSDENPDSYNKMKYHASKMDLNLRILRDQMSNLKDTGDTLSRQMASMYRNFQKVKEDDTVSGDGDSEDSGDDNMGGRSCVDTEDDVNQMTDLDADESSISSRRGPLPQGQLANLQRKRAAQNGSKNVNSRGKGQDNQRSQQNASRINNLNVRDRNDNDVSSDITTTTTRNVPQSAMDGDVEDASDDDTLSESECSGNCLCCSSIASYQGIPWTIRRPSSAETTEYDSDSSECSDYEDDRYRSRKTPLHARLSPFFHQECSHSEDSSPMDGEDEGEARPVKRMSPLGCESPNKTDASPESKNDSKPKGAPKGASGGPPKPAPKPSLKPKETAKNGSRSTDGKGQGKQSPRETKDKDKAKAKEVSPSQAVGLGAVSRSEKSSGTVPSSKKSDDTAESSKSKARHVSKTAIVLLDPEAEFKDGNTVKKRSNFLPQQQPIEVPLSYVDKNGCITLTPDPKLAPEAFKAGKTITFKVRAATEQSSTNPDGSMVFTPTPSPSSRPTMGKTVMRVASTESPPVSIAAEEIGHEHQIQVSPEGIIRLSKRKPVPMQVFMPQFQQQQQQQPQQQSATIRLTSGGGSTQGEHDTCPNCHRKAHSGVAQQHVQPSSNVASNVRVIHMSPGITPSPVPPSTQGRVQVIQRQDSGHSSPPTARQQVFVQQEPIQVPQNRPGQVIIKRQDSGQLRVQTVQMQPEQDYQPFYHQQVNYPQEIYQQQGYTQPSYPHQVITSSNQGMPTTIRLGGQSGETISIPIHPGTQTVQRQVIHQSGAPTMQQMQPMQPMQPSGGSGVTTIRFGDGAPIKVTPGQGMRFVINPK